MYAMDYQLDKILDEGLSNRYKRHLEMAKMEDLGKGKLELFPKEGTSNTLTAIRYKEIDINLLNKKLG